MFCSPTNEWKSLKATRTAQQLAIVIAIYSECQGANFCTFENKILNIS